MVSMGRLAVGMAVVMVTVLGASSVNANPLEAQEEAVLTATLSTLTGDVTLSVDGVHSPFVRFGLRHANPGSLDTLGIVLSDVVSTNAGTARTALPAYGLRGVQAEVYECLDALTASCNNEHIARATESGVGGRLPGWTDGLYWIHPEQAPKQVKRADALPGTLTLEFVNRSWPLDDVVLEIDLLPGVSTPVDLSSLRDDYYTSLLRFCNPLNPVVCRRDYAADVQVMRKLFLSANLEEKIIQPNGDGFLDLLQLHVSDYASPGHGLMWRVRDRKGNEVVPWNADGFEEENSTVPFPVDLAKSMGRPVARGRYVLDLRKSLAVTGYTFTGETSEVFWVDRGQGLAEVRADRRTLIPGRGHIRLDRRVGLMALRLARLRVLDEAGRVKYRDEARGAYYYPSGPFGLRNPSLYIPAWRPSWDGRCHVYRGPCLRKPGRYRMQVVLVAPDGAKARYVTPAFTLRHAR
jgi:hypothetical protein